MQHASFLKWECDCLQTGLLAKCTKSYEYGEPKYGEPKYGEPKYGEPKYGEPKSSRWTVAKKRNVSSTTCCILLPIDVLKKLPPWCSGEGVRLESGRPGFHSLLHCGSFSRLSHTTDFKLGTPVATLPAIMRSALGLASPVYCDWVREQFNLQLLSQCGSTCNCLSRSASEIH